MKAGHLTTLAKALEAAGLVEAVKAKGPFTAFAPTDEASAKLPSGTLENVPKPENQDTLKAVPSMHLVPEDPLNTDGSFTAVAPARDAVTLRIPITHGGTAGGGHLIVTARPGQPDEPQGMG